MIKERNADDQVKTNTFHEHLSSNKTQIILIIIALFPSIILFGLTFASLWFYQKESLALISNFAEQLFQDQINNSKMQNSALLFQINQQVQRIPWELNLINECLSNILLGVIVKNKNHIPAFQNQDRAYNDNEDPVILSLFKQNKFLTSVWHHISKSYINQLDDRSIQQLIDASRMDTVLRPILYNNNIKENRQMTITAIYFGHSYDGLLYINGRNSTYKGLVQPSWCPYTGPFLLDVRCRFYYVPTMMEISTQIFSPQLQFGGLQGYYLATAYCQRRLRYHTSDPNSHSDSYGLLCMTLDLSQIPQYFQNFGSNSKLQMFLDPQQLTVVYDSLQPLQSSQIATVQQFETQYLQDQTQAKKFLDNISHNFQFILSNTSTIDLSNTFDTDQPSFEYNRNGTECFVIMNTVKMIDMVPRYEYLKKVNPSSKYQIKSVYLFLDVLSKQQMQQYSTTLQNTIKNYNLIFTYVSLGIILFLLAIQFYYSILLGKQILSPLIHLTNILKQIRIQNRSLKEKILSQHSRNALNDLSQSEMYHSMQNEYESSSNVILIDQQLDADVDGVCFSSDTQILLESFQNMFKILRFTTQNFYKENESISLLNLNIQIEHFQQFGNFRALGVCHNNMGVIHYNCGRYQEAVEHFQKAIIYAKYELKAYSHDSDDNDFWGKVHRFSVSLRNSLQSNQSSSLNNDSVKQVQNSNTNIENSPVNTEKQHLYWNLYNRNENYIKALSLYIRNNQNNLWETFIEIAYENTSLSQIFLPPSSKREVMNFYAISIGYNQLNLSENNYQVLQKIEKLYRQSISQINNNAESTIQNSKISHSQQPYFRNNPCLIASQSVSVGSFQKQEQLLSPLKKYKKMFLKEHSQTSKMNDLLDTSSHNKFTNSNHKHLHLNTPKHSLLKSNDAVTSLITPMNLRESLLKPFFQNTKEKQEKHEEMMKLQSSIVEEDSQIGLMKYQSVNESHFNQDMSHLRLSHKQIGNTTKSSLKNVYSDKSHQPKLTILNKLSSKLQKLNINSVQDKSSELKMLQTSEKVQKYLKTQNSKKQKREDSVNQKNKKALLTSSHFNRNKDLSNSILNNSMRSSKLDSSTQKDNNQLLNSFVNSIRKKIQKQMQAKINYPVRKMKNDQQISCYEFNSDIIFIYYALQQSKYLISQNNFYSAAQLLSNVLEKTKYYLPHHKIQILELLTQIFKINCIESTDLKEMKRKYKKYMDYNFHICLISSCNKNQNKEKVYALSQDITKEILFKEKDTFGLLAYSFEEHLFQQLMSFTPIQIIKSNFIFFECIFHQLLYRQNNRNAEYSKEGNQQREFSQYQHPINEQSFLKEIKNKNSFEQDNIQCNPIKIQNNHSPNSTFNEQTTNDHKQNIFPHQQQEKQQQLQCQQQLEYQISGGGKISTKLEEETGNQSKMYNSFSQETILLSPDNCEIDSIEQNYYLIEIEKQTGKSTEQKNKINALNLQRDQSISYHKISPYLNCSTLQQKMFFQKQLKLEEQKTFSIHDNLPHNPKMKNLNNQSSFDKEYQQHSLKYNKKTMKNSLFENSNSSITQGQNVLLQKPSQPEQSLSHLQRLSSVIQQTKIQSNLNASVIKQVHGQNKDFSSSVVERMTSEQVFHQGVNAAIKQFILNTDQKLTNYLTKRKLYDHSNKSSSSKAKNLQKSQVYLIYVTDQPLEFKQKDLLNYLCEFLINLEIELLVLEINENQSCEEFSLLQNLVLYGKSVITFFHTEAKLLQYIYNTREHLKNNLIPMIFEHF